MDDLTPGSIVGCFGSSMVSGEVGLEGVELGLDGIKESQETSFLFGLQVLVGLDGRSPELEDLGLVGELEVSIDNLAIGVEVEWGAVGVLGFEFGSSGVVLVDDSSSLEPLVDLLTKCLSLEVG